MSSDIPTPEDELDDSDVPVLEDVVVAGPDEEVEDLATGTDLTDETTAATELPETQWDTSPAETEPTGVAEPTPAIDVQTLAATVERIAADMRGELERKFRGVVALAVEEALARSLRQYEEHVRLSILSHLLERMPEILDAARREEPDDR